jgi:hypothetical protein
VAVIRYDERVIVRADVGVLGGVRSRDVRVAKVAEQLD